MSLPLVSVVIDTYNYGHFVERAIESALSQDFPADRMEILVVDDGSTDDTAARVQKYGSRIQYLQKPNGGQASAFNWGFNRARGDVICFLDADDFWLPGKLQRVVNAFESTTSAMVYHDYKLSDPDPQGRVATNLDLVSGHVLSNFRDLMRYRIFPTSCLAFRREKLGRLMPVPETIRFMADAYLALLVVFVGPIFAIPEELTIYRIHDRNLYSVDAARSAPEALRRRSETFKTILREVRLWVARNGVDVNEREVRAFLDQWTIFQQNAEYRVDPPSRWEYFSHVLRYNRTYRAQQNWKLTVLNYFSAVAALALGYKQPNRQVAVQEEVRHA